jgi:PAS domain S-box-containing protein
VDATADVVIDCNDRATQLLGYERGELLGMELREFHTDELDAISSFKRRVEENGTATAENVTYVTASGELLPVNLSASLVGIDDEPYLMLGIQDISDRKREEQLNAVMNRVLRHNVQTDVNIIRGNTELVREQLTDPQSIERLATVETRAVNLEGLSQKAREIRQKVINEPARESYPVSDLLSRLESMLTDRYEVDLRIAPWGGATRQVSARLFAILEELCANAIEHTDADRPTINVAAARDDSAGMIEVWVADRGSGMPDLEQEIITTERETQLSHGQGLGLWLIRWLTMDLNGTVRIAWSDGSGTGITVRVPEIVE